MPEAAAGDEHLRILTLLSRKLVARKLMDTGFRERLTAAPDEAAALGCWAGSSSPFVRHTPWTQWTPWTPWTQPRTQ
ncbi:hypothetical protein OG883_27320 [Streptomyces sp. NBC_01142]|uniref:hypothetical protein n=1 Tax=Streptomyces sp. NBC_01142 TaxID=2975865 RepID=UPI00224D22B8|nr:hypothetical protein [Streptomyces sp. NBC_01142]MCX4823520.1 hypothetical protein [Streptomyces sp. NBC_01142]